MVEEDFGDWTIAHGITDMFGASIEVAAWRRSLSRSLFSRLISFDRSYSVRSVECTAQRSERGKGISIALPGETHLNFLHHKEENRAKFVTLFWDS